MADDHDISAIIEAVEKCGNKRAKAQLAAMFALQQRIYVAMNGTVPSYGLEDEWAAILVGLSTIGLQLLKFLGG